MLGYPGVDWDFEVVVFTAAIGVLYGNMYFLLFILLFCVFFFFFTGFTCYGVLQPSLVAVMK